MDRKIPWYEHIGLNTYFFGLSVSSGIITPLLLPFLVVAFMPEAQKNTYLSVVRSIGLAVAMLVQPIAGMISDRSTSPWGRRRPFIVVSAIGNILFLALIWSSTLFPGFGQGGPFSALNLSTAYVVLMLGIVLLQVTSNIGQAAAQGIIPDLVPENQRGRSSGFKSVLELIPTALAIAVGPIFASKSLTLQAKTGIMVAIIAAVFIISMLITLVSAKEKPRTEKPGPFPWTQVLRIVALTVIFVGITYAMLAFVNTAGKLVAGQNASVSTRILLVGLTGLVAMAVAIFVGVYFGAWVGIGKEARQRQSFIWWVINRLMFLAAVGSVQGFAQFFLRDVIKVPNPPTTTSILLGVVAVFLLPSAVGGGYLSDRMGRKRLVAASGFIAALGTLVILVSRAIPLVIVGGSILGIGTGLFMATNWALGTTLISDKEAGRYLGISNLAGAGAGIVGAGIGGPMADSFNQIQPGLGYLVIFAIYAGLFLLSVVTLLGVKTQGKAA